MEEERYGKDIPFAGAGHFALSHVLVSAPRHGRRASAKPAPDDVDDVPGVVDPGVRVRQRLEGDVHAPHLAPRVSRQKLRTLLREVARIDPRRPPRGSFPG